MITVPLRALRLVDSLHIDPTTRPIRATMRRRTHAAEHWVSEHAGIEPGVKALGVVVEGLAHAITTGVIAGPNPSRGATLHVHSTTLQRAVLIEETLDVDLALTATEGTLTAHWDSFGAIHRHARGVIEVGAAFPKIEKPQWGDVTPIDLSAPRLSQSVIIDEVGIITRGDEPPTAVAHMRAPRHLPWLLVEEGLPPPFLSPLWILEAMGQAALIPFSAINGLDPTRDVLLGQRVRSLWVEPDIPPGAALTFVVSYTRPILGRMRLRADVSAWMGPRPVAAIDRLVCLQMPMEAFEA